MKYRVVVLILMMAMIAGPAQAGLFKDSVDLADLGQVDPAALQSLKETEFGVFLAQVRLNAAKAAERRAGGGVKTAKRMLDAEDLDLKAATAEVKAAEANEDAARREAAAAVLAGAREDLRTAKLLITWQEQEKESAQARVRMAKAGVDLAESRRDVARVRLMQQEKAPGAGKYALADFEKNVSSREKDHGKALRKSETETGKAAKAKAAWEQVSKNEFVPDEE